MTPTSSGPRSSELRQPYIGPEHPDHTSVSGCRPGKPIFTNLIFVGRCRFCPPNHHAGWPGAPIPALSRPISGGVCCGRSVGCFAGIEQRLVLGARAGVSRRSHKQDETRRRPSLKHCRVRGPGTAVVRKGPPVRDGIGIERGIINRARWPCQKPAPAFTAFGNRLGGGTSSSRISARPPG